MVVRDVIGVMVAIVVVAGIAVALRPGSQTPAVLEAGSKGFADVLRAATLQQAA